MSPTSIHSDSDIWVRVNGVKAAVYNTGYKTGKMLFSAQHFIARITQYMTLYPGDSLWLGAPTKRPGRRSSTATWLSGGNDRIGVLRNPVVRAEA